MSEKCDLSPTIFGHFSDIFRHFSDILSTFPFSWLSNDLPITKVIVRLFWRVFLEHLVKVGLRTEFTPRTEIHSP